MKARYDGKCHACYRNHVKKGDEIVRDGWGWSRPECKKKREKARWLQQAVESRMDQHRIALGVFGIPEGFTPTFTRAEFLLEARKRNEITAEEEALLCWHWSSIIHRCLAE